MAADFRDTLYTIDQRGRRKWVYPSLVKGQIFWRRLIVAYSLVLFYLVMPWLVIGGKQGIFIDIIHRRFVFFGIEFWATDTFFLFLLLAGAGIALFFFTALFGRVWCGWACPETVFLEFVFRPIERLIEGGPAQRLRLDQQPWGIEKIWKKMLKHSISASFAWVLASTFLAYFIGADKLLNMMVQSPLSNPGLFSLTIILMGVLGFQFGWFREQFCTVLCPYARFQSVLMDDNSLVVGYDRVRGEPRGKIKKNESTNSEHGDCVDCGLCVRVCPTGIDIRNGLQLECINCTACIDACNSIMEKVGRPLGLIRYDTESRLKGGKIRIVRPRVVIYASVLVVALLVFSYKLSYRELSEIQIVRGALDSSYNTLPNDVISNHLHVHISNKSGELRKYEFISPDPMVALVTPVSPFPVSAESMLTTPLFVNFPKTILDKGKRKIQIEINDDHGFTSHQEITILGPDE